MNRECDSVRTNRRKPFLTGISRKGVAFEDDEWYKKNITALLDAHCKCQRPGLETALYDVQSMLASGHALINIDRKKKQTTEGEDLAQEKRRSYW